MVSFDFEYHKPSSIKEAIQLFSLLDSQKKKPIYFSGGTEIITLGRLNLISTGALIDLNAIPECSELKIDNNRLIIGAVQPLTKIEEANLFPLLRQTVSDIADRTSRNKITVGGNICGQIFYREAVLPFLLCDSQVVIASQSGIKTIPIQLAFNQKLYLEKGEFLLQIITEKRFLDYPWISCKKRRQWDTGYPLLTVAAMKVDGRLRFAFSGLSPFPFRSEHVENLLNNSRMPINTRVKSAIDSIRFPILNDTEGSAQYRLFVLKNTLQDIVTVMEGAAADG